MICIQKKMESSLLQWESDPLFSAAEVVQDSADRMESFFRLLLHEKTLLQRDLPDPKLLTSIGYHTRDLATVLETAKWQLEDFERAVNSSARMDQSHSREHVISRHKQFIISIRGQINDVEKSLEDMEMGNPMKNSKWGNLNQQDRDGLALFLSGGNHNEHDVGFDLDPVSASCSTDAGIVANGCGEIEEVNTNGVAYSSHYYGSMKENNLRKVGSHYSIKLGVDAANSCNGNSQDRSLDLEASESKPKSSLHENKLRSSSSQINLFRFFNNLWSRVPSNYTKRLKDGEVHTPLHIDTSLAAQHSLVALVSNLILWSESLSQGQHIGLSSAPGDNSGFLVKVMHLRRRLGACDARFARFSYLFKLNRRSVQMILTIVYWSPMSLENGCLQFDKIIIACLKEISII
ncbi:Syntaxin-61-like protein [Gossypium australe]|uniref:Syntaxin-61-like protein n=1 Tax=Gossypium australe TaxID=47621 RepID=A0A5B6VCW0_9ROSI|nr:Syntaxin-61-like protein [Gossypium australe]